MQTIAMSNVCALNKPATLRSRKVVHVCSSLKNSSPVPIVPKDKPRSTYLQFAEKINGRCAMQGFLWGSVNQYVSHKGFVHQCFEISDAGNLNINSHNLLTFASVIALVTLGTAITDIRVNDYESKGTPFIMPRFTPENELLNGRFAMLGVLISVLKDFS